MADKAQIKDLQRQNSELSVMNSYLLGVANEKDLEIARLEEKAFRLTEQLKKDFDDYQKETNVQRDGHQDQIKLLKAQIVHLEGKIEGMSDVSDENEVLKERVRELESKIEGVRTEYEHRISHAKSETFSTKSALAEEYRRKIQELTDKMESNLVQSLPEEARRAHQNNIELREHLLTQGRHVDEIMAKMSKLEVHAKKMKVERDLSAEEAAASVKEAASLRLQVSNLKKTVKETATELKRLRAQSSETEKLQQELHSLKTANSKQQKQLEKLTAEARARAAVRKKEPKKTYLGPI
ncbi:chromosome segregation protein [Carpediemonas membranifera]|uniref:Chromosome segregation protein n=1 Tax=Carpediemonas membranifera TaxID=201153 RepID=A0A8J6AXJ3_9EUKA|nr:chromosome segregation protein [Carpediemonas membranifera]|eukprot:KAG9397306.1 chromosome segregation protein [Carpediemonas membranifera]